MATAIVKTSEFREGEPRRVELEGKGVLIALVGGRFYAIGDRCPHLGCSLSKGTLEGTTITCPCHGSTFDITNGKLVAWVGTHPTFGKLTAFMKKDVPAYSVTAEGDDMIIGG